MNDAPHSDDKRAAASDSCASEAAPSLPASPAPVDVISEAPTSGVEDEHTRAVTAMFSRMTPWYDFQNHAFSLGFDFWWRRNLVRAVAPGPTGVVLDLAAGTLDVTLALIRRYPGLRVIAADICAPMLDYGMERKVKPDEKERITPLVADARRLPLPDASVDAVTIAFGIRNVRPRAEALAEIAAFLPAPDMLAVENLEAFPPTFWDGWIDGTPYSRCLDVGHIWKAGGDPAPVLAAWLPRVRVIHLHGLEPRAVAAPPSPSGGAPVHRLRDHKSLRFTAPDRIDAVMHPLWRQGFGGVLNLEVFCLEDFIVSHAALLQSWERYAGD